MFFISKLVIQRHQSLRATVMIYGGTVSPHPTCLDKFMYGRVINCMQITQSR